MREAVLRDFLNGAASALTLKNDLAGTVVQTGSNTSAQYVTPMSEVFLVTRDHLLRLCDAVLEGQLEPEDLEPIAFCLIASDQFQFEDSVPLNERVLDTLHDWDSPEINYVLNRGTVEKFKKRLLTGENLFTQDDLAKLKSGSSQAMTHWAKTLRQSS